MSPVVNVAAASAPPRNSSNITSSKARSQSARSYLHKEYLKVGLKRLQKHRAKGGLKSTLIHPSAWKEISAKSDFRFTEFSEVQHAREGSEPNRFSLCSVVPLRLCGPTATQLDHRMSSTR